MDAFAFPNIYVVMSTSDLLNQGTQDATANIDGMRMRSRDQIYRDSGPDAASVIGAKFNAKSSSSKPKTAESFGKPRTPYDPFLPDTSVTVGSKSDVYIVKSYNHMERGYLLCNENGDSLAGYYSYKNVRLAHHELVVSAKADEIAADKPAADEPAADEPAADEPAADKPAVAESLAADEPAVAESVEHAPVEPAADEPAVADKPLTDYERGRLANIERNEKHLCEISLCGPKTGKNTACKFCRPYLPIGVVSFPKPKPMKKCQPPTRLPGSRKRAQTSRFGDMVDEEEEQLPPKKFKAKHLASLKIKNVPVVSARPTSAEINIGTFKTIAQNLIDRCNTVMKVTNNVSFCPQLDNQGFRIPPVFKSALATAKEVLQRDDTVAGSDNLPPDFEEMKNLAVKLQSVPNWCASLAVKLESKPNGGFDLPERPKVLQYIMTLQAEVDENSKSKSYFSLLPDSTLRYIVYAFIADMYQDGPALCVPAAEGVPCNVHYPRIINLGFGLPIEEPGKLSHQERCILPPKPKALEKGTGNYQLQKVVSENTRDEYGWIQPRAGRPHVGLGMVRDADTARWMYEAICRSKSMREKENPKLALHSFVYNLVTTSSPGHAEAVAMFQIIKDTPRPHEGEELTSHINLQLAMHSQA